MPSLSTLEMTASAARQRNVGTILPILCNEIRVHERGIFPEKYHIYDRKLEINLTLSIFPKTVDIVFQKVVAELELFALLILARSRHHFLNWLLS